MPRSGRCARPSLGGEVTGLMAQLLSFDNVVGSGKQRLRHVQA